MTEYDDYEYDSMQYDSLDMIRQQSQNSNTEILQIEDVIKVIKQTVAVLQEQLYESEDNTFELLMYYNWNKDEIDQKYFADQALISEDLKKRGILNNHEGINSTKIIEMCSVCLCDGPKLILGCGHSFCEFCVQQTIQQRVIKERHLVVRCLQVGCVYRLPFSMIRRYTDEKEFNVLLCRNFVETSKYLAYCTGVDCNKIIQPKSTSMKEVMCSCGTKFCFSCKEDLHPPAPCDIVKKWMTEVKKDEANVRWIAVNTKICPFCKRPVERSEGCNYMMCKPPGGCGKAFCYVCSNPWEPDHKDHFKCNRYVAPVDDVEKEKEVLQKYNFYYERFLNSSAAKEKAQLRLKSVNDIYVTKIFDIYQLTYQDSQFLSESLKELIESRVILKWSYCIGYYISKNNQQSAKLFDHYQAQFDHSCESLAINLIKLFDEIDSLANLAVKEKKTIHDWTISFITMKEQIQNASKKCLTMRKNLENAIYNGDISM